MTEKTPTPTPYPFPTPSQAIYSAQKTTVKPPKAHTKKHERKEPTPPFDREPESHSRHSLPKRLLRGSAGTPPGTPPLEVSQAQQNTLLQENTNRVTMHPARCRTLWAGRRIGRVNPTPDRWSSSCLAANGNCSGEIYPNDQRTGNGTRSECVAETDDADPLRE